MAIQTSIQADWETFLKNLHVCIETVPSASSRRLWVFDAMTDLDVGTPCRNCHGHNPYASVPSVDTSYVESCLNVVVKFATQHDIIVLALGDKDAIWKPVRKQLTDAKYQKLHRMILAYTDDALDSRAKARQRASNISPNDRFEMFGAKTIALEDKCRCARRVPGFTKALNPTSPAELPLLAQLQKVTPETKTRALKRTNATVFGSAVTDLEEEEDAVPYAYHERDTSTLEEISHLASVGTALFFTPGAGAIAKVATRMKTQHPCTLR